MFSPRYDPAYDPVEHLDRMGVRLVKHTLHDSNAVWVPERRMVVIDRGLPSELVRPTLAHEADHAENDDPGGHHPRNEARANLHSALRLTNPALWSALTRTTGDFDLVCNEIGITRRQFRALYEHLRRTDASQARLQRIGNMIYTAPKMGAGQWEERIEVA